LLFTVASLPLRRAGHLLQGLCSLLVGDGLLSAVEVIATEARHRLGHEFSTSFPMTAAMAEAMFAAGCV
jgi:hypothetical protein